MIVELLLSVRLVPFVPVRTSARPDVVTMLKLLSVSTTNGVPVRVIGVVWSSESVTVCAETVGENSNPLPKAMTAATADSEAPEDSAPICGDMLAARPFHLIIRPPRKSSASKAQDRLEDVMQTSI